MDISSPSANRGVPQVGLVSGVALSLSGMMGSGLFSILGHAYLADGTNFPFAFMLASVAILFSVYAVSKLATTYPGPGGPARFALVCYGPGFMSGWINLFLYLCFLLATALYAAGFSAYIGALAGSLLTAARLKLLGVGLVVLFALVNLLGANRVGRVASILILLVFCALLWFSATGLAQIHPVRPSLSGVTWRGVLVATAMLYINFQGFGMVVSASQSMANPAKTVPRAMFIAIGVISALYFVVSWVAIQITPHDVLAANAENMLGAAAKIIAGSIGSKVIALAALLACAAAVNASIFTASRILTSVVSDHPASNMMRLALGQQPHRPLLLSAGIVILLILYFPLVAVGKMASMAFLLFFSATMLGHLRIYRQTGARPWVLWLGALINFLLFTFLFVDGLRIAPETIVFLLLAVGGTLLAEASYRLKIQKNGSRMPDF